MIPLIIQDQFYIIQNLQRSPILQTSNWSGTFVCCFLQQTGSSLRFKISIFFCQITTWFFFQVRSLTNLSDFSLDVSNGNYDNYGGITDSLLSAEASKDLKQEGGSPGGTVAPGGHRHPTHHGHHQTQQHNPGTHGSSGPLLDFKSAFSDLDTKPSDLR